MMTNTQISYRIGYGNPLGNLVFIFADFWTLLEKFQMTSPSSTLNYILSLVLPILEKSSTCEYITKSECVFLKEVVTFLIAREQDVEKIYKSALNDLQKHITDKEMVENNG